MGETGRQPLGHIFGTDGRVATCRFGLGAWGDQGDGDDQTAKNRSVGAIVRIDVRGTPVFGTIVSLHTDPADADKLIAECEYIGEGSLDTNDSLTGFRRGVVNFPQPGDPVRMATESELATIFAPPAAAHISIGTVFPTKGVRAPVLFDQLLGRHFAIVGSSGSGKSTSVALMLHRIVDEIGGGHVVVLDPHGEYARAFGDRAQVWDVDNLVVPYWALNLEEHCDVFVAAEGDERTIDTNIMAKALQRARMRNIQALDPGRITADTPISYQYEDLIEALESEAGRLERIAEASRYTHLRLTIEQFFNDRRFRFMFAAEHASSSIEQLLGDLLRIPNAGKPISIVNLAGVPTEVVNVVVATLARLTLDYAIWAPRSEQAPVLLVCEEAHRYLPHAPSEATRSVRRQLERIAREGRKYGVCLGLVSQRPSELSSTALSQCGTIMSLRLNNQADQGHLIAALTEGARSIAGAVGALRNRECIISGEGVPLPMRVMIDTLEPAKRPASDDPSFSEKWGDDRADRETLGAVMRRWRAER